MQPNLKLLQLNDSLKDNSDNTTQQHDNIFELNETAAENEQLKKQLKKALEEKEILLREVHHRVKNNLQLIISMLSLQASASYDNGIKSQLKSAQSRVKAIAIAHHHIYKSHDLNKINIEDYLYSLSGHVAAVNKRFNEMVSVKISSHHIVLPLETAVPLGLLVNELLAKSICESHRSGKGVDIKINIFDNENGTFGMYYFDSSSHDVLTIKDGRVIDINNGLIDLLITQLEGNIQTISSSGLTYKINFRGSNYQTRLAFLV